MSALRLHHDGRFRRWLGARFGRDEAFGDRLWRRLLHGAGAAVLLYYALPTTLVGVVPRLALLLAALAAVLLLELLRHGGILELPALRDYEHGRPASFVFYATALVAAVLLLPVPIAAAVVLGTSVVDPIAGELRASPRACRAYPWLPYVAWVVLATIGLVPIGGWPLPVALELAALAGGVAIAAEWPTLRWVDDDLVMLAAPAVVLYALGVVVLGLPAGG